MLTHVLVGFVLVYFESVMPMTLAQIRVRRGQFKVCPKSLDTMNYVTSCPKSIESWKNRSEEKNCASVKQDCGEAFAYHCLINEWENATLEVCAVSTTIIGYLCAEFNTGGTIIVEHYGLSCRDFQQPCPFSYRSVDAYKYPACFDAVHHNSMSISTTETRIQEYPTNAQLHSRTTSSPFRSELQIGVIIIVIFYAIICLITMVIVVKKRNKCGVHADGEPYIKLCEDKSVKITLITTQPPEEKNSTEGVGTDCDQYYKMWSGPHSGNGF